MFELNKMHPAKLLLALFFFAITVVIAAIYMNEGGDLAKAALTIPTFGYTSLTDSVNKIKTRARFLQSKIFRKMPPAPTKYIQADVIVGNRKIAPFVRRGAPAKVMSKLGKETQLFEPPTIRMKKPLDAEDLLFTRAEGSPIHVIGGGSGALNDYRLRRIGEEQLDLKEKAIGALEWMCGQALGGAISYTGDDVEFSIDMQMPVANKPSLAGGALWSAPSTAVPIDNLTAWKALVKKKTGLLPTIAIMNDEVWNAFFATDQVQKYFDKLKIDPGQIKTDQNILDMGAELVARINNVEFYTYNEVYDDAAGTETNLIATNRFVLATPAADNKIHYGAVSDLEAGAAAVEFFSKDWVEKDPSTYNILVETHPLPVVHRPETVVYAKVL